jgi:signal transduction histidine kinase
MISPKLVRTVPFRWALGFAVALTGSTIAIFGYIYWQTAQLETQAKDHYLEVEAEIAVQIPAPLLAEQIKIRLANAISYSLYNALFDSQGQRIAGNLAEIPATLPIDGVAHRNCIPASMDGGPHGDKIIFVAQRRPDGTVFVIGRDLDNVIALRDTVLKALERGMIPTIVLALLVGTLMARNTLDRIKTLGRTIGRIMDGDLNGRLPVKGTGDDLDNLSVQVNEMLDSIVNLMGEIKSVGDNIAHDLRTPLTVMHARLERGLAEGGRDALHEIIRQSLSDLERTFATITSLLRIAEIENGRRLRCVTRTELGEILEEVYELYEPLAAVKTLDFAIIHGTPTYVEADRDMLIEAVANLVDNAIKFAPTGGMVRVELIDEPTGPIIRVKDNGPGIPSAERSNVTRRFYRSNKSPPVHGSGLGLSLVTAIATLHGFRLCIAEVDQGSSIEIVCTPGKAPAPS